MGAGVGGVGPPAEGAGSGIEPEVAGSRRRRRAGMPPLPLLLLLLLPVLPPAAGTGRPAPPGREGRTARP